jgi:hypothetical protein
MVDPSFAADLDAPKSQPSPALNTRSLVGLFLMMLALFILLVSISRPTQERARAVMFGIAAAFNPNAASGIGRSALDLPRGDAPTAGFLPDMGRLVATAIPLADTEETRDGKRLRIVVPASSLFTLGSDELKPDAETLLASIAQAMARQPAGFRYELEFLVARGVSPERKMAINRAGLVGRALVSAGTPINCISVGLLASTRDTAIFLFSIRDTPPSREAAPQAVEQP